MRIFEGSLARFTYRPETSGDVQPVGSPDKYPANSIKQSTGAELGNTLAAVREVWEPETTARNLRLIREVRKLRKEELAWVNEIEDQLNKRIKT